MDVTPSKKMFESMTKFVDAVYGEAPLGSEKSTAANQTRDSRKFCMDYLHKLVHLSMREGAARAMNTHSPLGIIINSRVHNTH